MARKPNSLRKAPLMTSIALACAMFAGNAGASGIPTVDISHIIQAIIKFVDDQGKWIAATSADAAEYGEQLARFQELRDKYDRALSQLNDMLNNVKGATFAPEIKKVSPTYGMSIECPGQGAGLNISNLLSSMASELSGQGEWKAEQRRICMEIVYFQNMQYNASVDVLLKMKERMSELDDLAGDAVGGENDEAAKSGTLAMMDAMNKSLAELQYSQAEINAYKSRIETLQRQQNIIAKSALQGDTQGPLGALGGLGAGVVGTATLKLALESID